MPFFLCNGAPCLNPADVIEAMEAEGLPTDAVRKANSLTLQHGRQPNTGYFLIRNKDFKKLFLSSSSSQGKDNINIQPITISIVEYDNITNQYVDLYSGSRFYITNAINVLSSENNDNAVLLIKVQDTRYWFNRTRCYASLNFISSNNADVFGLSATPNNFKQYNTTKLGTTFFTVEECLKILYYGFIRTFDGLTYSSHTVPGYPYEGYSNIVPYVQYNDTDLDDYLHNLEFSQGTYLDAFCKICEASRLPFYIYTDKLSNPSTDPNGFTFLLNSTPIDWPIANQNKLIHETTDLADYMIPRRVIVGCLHEDYVRYNDLDTSQRPNHYRYSYETYIVPDDVYENQANIDIFVPHLIMRTGDSINTNNSAEVEAHLVKIAKRFTNIVSSKTRSATWVGYTKLEDKMSFGLDKIVYQDLGYGFTSTAIGLGVDDYDLNYTTPAYATNYDIPSSLWVYQFKVVTQGYGTITADLFTHDGVETPLTGVTVEDPLNIFMDLGTDDMGLCIRVPTVNGVLYYAIQAPCSGIS